MMSEFLINVYDKLCPRCKREMKIRKERNSNLLGIYYELYCRYCKQRTFLNIKDGKI